MPLIEFVNVETPDDFYAQLSGQVPLDYDMGNTLDAVYDVLTTEVEGPVEIIWHNADMARAALGEWFLRLVDVLHTAAQQRGDMIVSLQ
jgi:ribonuclease inhibitor